eukprot:687281-Rhodomonas_salina.2
MNPTSALSTEGRARAYFDCYLHREDGERERGELSVQGARCRLLTADPLEGGDSEMERQSWIGEG